jgi:hypothetical protein
MLLYRFARRIWRDRAFWAKVVDPCAKATPAKYSTIEKTKQKENDGIVLFCLFLDGTLGGYSSFLVGKRKGETKILYAILLFFSQYHQQMDTSHYDCDRTLCLYNLSIILY